MLWAHLHYLIRKKDTKSKIHIRLTRLLRCLSVKCPGPSFPVSPVQRILSRRERPGVHSSPTWLWVISDCGLVLSRDICSWSHSWTCSGSGVVWGGPGWCQVETVGCRDTQTDGEYSQQCMQGTQPHPEPRKPGEMLLIQWPWNWLGKQFWAHFLSSLDFGVAFPKMAGWNRYLKISNGPDILGHCTYAVTSRLIF